MKILYVLVRDLHLHVETKFVYLLRIVILAIIFCPQSSSYLAIDEAKLELASSMLKLLEVPFLDRDGIGVDPNQAMLLVTLFSMPCLLYFALCWILATPHA